MQYTFKLSLGGLFLLASMTAWAEQKTVCCIDGAPAGFIRTGSTTGANSHCPTSDPQILNMCTYVRYDNLPSGSKLRVCANSPTPTGWNESPPYVDLHGCDAQAVAGALNMKVITKK